MSLFDTLDGAELVVADEERGLLFIWYGSATVQIANEQGEVLEAFSISTAFERKLTAREVRKVIDRYRASMDDEDES